MQGLAPARECPSIFPLPLPNGSLANFLTNSADYAVFPTATLLFARATAKLTRTAQPIRISLWSARWSA